MRASEKTFRSLRRMHGLFWFSSLALLAATVWMLVSDANRPWKKYQQEYRANYAPSAPGGIRQIVLPELTKDLHFRRVARCDRCTTCHLGIANNALSLPLGEGRGEGQEATEGKILQPFAAHPRLDLFVGSGSPHPAQEFGCTICHEGQGSATDFHWAAHTPNDVAAQKSWQTKYAYSQNPDWDFPMLPARFAESRCLACHPNVTDLEPSARFPDPPAPKLVVGYQLIRRLGCFGCHELENGPSGGSRKTWLGGESRKSGPSLRQLTAKTSIEHTADRIADPSHFLPESTMPRLFGLQEHLDDPARTQTKRFEAVEIRAISAYLMQASESAADSIEPVTSATESASAERGKNLFERQGCLACHKHQDFPQGQAIQGPDLSRVKAKYTAKNARSWLVAWLRDPAHSVAQTWMPNPRLEKTLPADGDKMTDPAEDLAAYLLASPAEFQNATLPEFDEKDLDALAMLYSHKSEKDETAEKTLLSVGKLAIAKRGCFGCHDIAGFENSQGIGPSLANWGRKPTAQLVFEKVGEYVGGQVANLPKNEGDLSNTGQIGNLPHGSRQDRNVVALIEHRREGFLWQKLDAPRSFDYRTTAKKNFNEYLRMGRFNLSDAEREAVMTFVLGLTADRPQGKYAYRPDAGRTAIIEGRKVLDRFACAECHTLQMERWTFAYKPSDVPAPNTPKNFAFLAPHFSEKELAASLALNRNGYAQAEIAGMPRLDSSGKILDDEDDEGRPVGFFTLFEPAAIAGHAWAVGGPDVAVPLQQIVKKRPAWGGTLARLLYPTAIADAKSKNFSSPEMEAWGWLPPPLAHEGAKVQPAWLLNYMQNPTTIRPASMLPMPKFNLSEEEAASLGAFFTANTQLNTKTFPPSPKTQAPRPKTDQQFNRSMQLVLDSQNFCAKCHLIGDYRPGGGANLAPNLANVGGRLQRQYTHHWLADPKTVLPYTPMPQLFPPDGEQGQEYLPGTSEKQLDAVEQLLVEYGEYAKEKMSIRKMMPPPKQPPKDGL